MDTSEIEHIADSIEDIRFEQLPDSLAEQVNESDCGAAGVSSLGDRLVDYQQTHAFRPAGTKWDRVTAYSSIDLLQDSNSYNTHAVRLCFDCMVIPALQGEIRCETCQFKRARRLEPIKVVANKTLPSHYWPHAAIYCLTILGCHYIGQAKDPARRQRQHLHSLSKGNHINTDLQTAYDASGGKYEWTILEHYPMTIEDMALAEEKWIRSHFPHVYNRDLPSGLTLEFRVLPSV